MSVFDGSGAMSNVDVAWLRMEHPTNLMVVTALLLFDRPLEPERLNALLEQRLLSFDRFRQRVVERGLLRKLPRWEADRRFDLTSHVRRVALPEPGDRAELGKLVSELMSTPLDYSKALWQAHLIENYGDGCAVVLRIHHCIADGIALMHVLLSLTDSRPVRGPVVRRSVGRARRPAWVVTTLVEEYARIMTHPSYALELARLGADRAAALGRLFLRRSDPQTVLKGPLGVAKLAAWSEPLRLADVKAVGCVTGSTVNDVLVAAMTGALRGYLQERGERVDSLNIHVAVPVNLRPMEHTPRLGNRFGLVILELPIEIGDSLERLFAVRRRMLELKRGPDADVALAILGTVGMTSAEIEKAFVDYVGSKITAVMTNVAGPDKPLYFAGERIRSILFWVPQSGRVAVGISILSYAGEVRLGVATDRGLVPDPESLVRAFHVEFDRLLALVLLPTTNAS